jgi:hypothetical protein
MAAVLVVTKLHKGHHNKVVMVVAVVDQLTHLQLLVVLETPHQLLQAKAITVATEANHKLILAEVAEVLALLVKMAEHQEPLLLAMAETGKYRHFLALL